MPKETKSRLRPRGQVHSSCHFIAASGQSWRELRLVPSPANATSAKEIQPSFRCDTSQQWTERLLIRHQQAKSIYRRSISKAGGARFDRKKEQDWLRATETLPSPTDKTHWGRTRLVPLIAGSIPSVLYLIPEWTDQGPHLQIHFSRTSTGTSSSLEHCALYWP